MQRIEGMQRIAGMQRIEGMKRIAGMQRIVGMQKDCRKLREEQDIQTAFLLFFSSLNQDPFYQDNLHTILHINIIHTA